MTQPYSGEIQRSGLQEEPHMLRHKLQYSIAALLAFMTVGAFVAWAIAPFFQTTPGGKWQPSVHVSKVEYVDVKPPRRVIDYWLRSSSGALLSFQDYEPFGDVDSISISTASMEWRYSGKAPDGRPQGGPPVAPVNVRKACDAVRELVNREVDVDALEWYKVSNLSPNYQDRRLPHSSAAIEISHGEACRIMKTAVRPVPE